MTDEELIARLRQVRRYRLVNEPGYQGQMLVRSDGKYVLHTDYVALEAKLAKLIGGAEVVIEAWDMVDGGSWPVAVEELRADVAEAKGAIT